MLGGARGRSGAPRGRRVGAARDSLRLMEWLRARRPKLIFAGAQFARSAPLLPPGVPPVQVSGPRARRRPQRRPRAQQWAGEGSRARAQVIDLRNTQPSQDGRVAAIGLTRRLTIVICARSSPFNYALAPLGGARMTHASRVRRPIARLAARPSGRPAGSSCAHFAQFPPSDSDARGSRAPAQLTRAPPPSGRARPLEAASSCAE